MEFRFGDGAGAAYTRIVVAGAVGRGDSSCKCWEVRSRLWIEDEVDFWFASVGGEFGNGSAVTHRYCVPCLGVH